MQILPSPVTSLNIIEMAAFGGTALYLNIGTQKGVLFRATIDKTSGQLSDTRARFLGLRPIKLFNVKVNGSDAVLALSSRSWLCYNYQGRYSMTPLSYVPLEYASSFWYPNFFLLHPHRPRLNIFIFFLFPFHSFTHPPTSKD